MYWKGSHAECQQDAEEDHFRAVCVPCPSPVLIKTLEWGQLQLITPQRRKRSCYHFPDVNVDKVAEQVSHRTETGYFVVGTLTAS